MNFTEKKPVTYVEYMSWQRSVSFRQNFEALSENPIKKMITKFEHPQTVEEIKCLSLDKMYNLISLELKGIH